MSRPYPNSDSIQPRYAAWLGSLGMSVDQNSIERVRQIFGPLRNVEFIEWINRCRKNAPVSCFSGERVTDHDAFTEHCWREAFARVQAEAA